jgi:hypothetical protein
MLKEFVEAIGSLAVQSVTPRVADFDEHKTCAYYENGTIRFRDALPKPRNHVAYDLGAIINFADRSDVSAIWYSRKAVVCVVDDDYRRDVVTLTLMLSEEILKLISLQQSRPSFDQRSFLTLMRTVFTPAALPMHPSLIGDLRVVKFDAAQSANTDIGRGKSSVGKSAIASVEGWDKLPEVVSLEVPVFANPFLTTRATVQCALEVNEQEQRFQLFPLPGKVEQAIAAVERELGKLILDAVGEVASNRVHYGEP